MITTNLPTAQSAVANLVPIVDRGIIERDVVRRLDYVGQGAPGISLTQAPLSNGCTEVVYRNADGEPIGIMGFNVLGLCICDYVVRVDHRRRRICTMLADWCRDHYGANRALPPFTQDGVSWANHWMAAQLTRGFDIMKSINKESRHGMG